MLHKSLLLLGCGLLLSVPLHSQGAADRAKIEAYLKTLPPSEPPSYTVTERLALAVNPLGCEEHPHAAPRNQPGYLWERDGKPQLLEEYDKHRAFYGCLDWHSAVNSTWMMVSLIKSDPSITVGPAIRADLQYHIQKSNIDGELAYFQHLQGVGADFEKPYGYAWLIKLYGELKTWNDPEGQRSATVLEPLATWMSARMIDYFHSLNYPVRLGLHPNTALDMGFILDSTSQTHDTALDTATREAAKRLFSGDRNCPTATEMVFADFASPCLAEAAVMGRVLEPDAYAKWIDGFLPPVYAEAFQVYIHEIDAVHGSNRDTTGTDEEGLPNAHLIGLNFQRAADLLWISRSLPQGDPRVPVYRRVGNMSGRQGYAKIGLGGYLGTHWLATYALLYENVADHKEAAHALNAAPLAGEQVDPGLAALDQPIRGPAKPVLRWHAAVV